MIDAFALLSEPRRPWLDADALKSRFLPLSSEVHPDRVHSASEAEKAAANSRYAELNAAYNTLREPRDRLLHLLELESGGKPRDVQRIPPGTMDLFVEVGQSCRDADGYLQRKSQSESPMLKLRLMQEGLDWLDRLQGLLTRVHAKRDEFIAELRDLNAAWEAAPAVGTSERPAALPLERLEQIYRGMSYVARWSEQVQERIVQLAI